MHVSPFQFLAPTVHLHLLIEVYRGEEQQQHRLRRQRYGFGFAVFGDESTVVASEKLPVSSSLNLL